MDYQNIYFIVDANSSIGYGHFKRCQLLVQEFKKYKVPSIYWFHDTDSQVIEKAEAMRVFPDKYQLINCLYYEELLPDSLVIIDSDDSYFYTTQFQNRLLKYKRKFMYISVKNTHFKSHYLFNQNLMAMYENYVVENYTKKFLGPDFFILDDNLAIIQPIELKIKKNNNLLITFGGADPSGLTLKVLDQLPEIEEQFDNIFVVVGALNKEYSHLESHPNIQRYWPKIKLLHNVEDMYSLMSKCTVAITSMGLTFWELTLHSIPCLVCSGSLREKPQASFFARSGYCHLIGHYDDPKYDQWGIKIKRLLSKPIVNNLRSKINIEGKTKLVSAILNPIELREATENDYESFFRIRSEKQNLFWTGYEKAPDYDTFFQWFKNRLEESDRDIYMAINRDGQIIGYLNFDQYEEWIAIGYAILSEYQGQGYATKIVKQATQLAKSKNKNLIAWISEKNIASQKVVQKNGFKPIKYEYRIRLGKEEKYNRFDFVVKQK